MFLFLVPTLPFRVVLLLQLITDLMVLVPLIINYLPDHSSNGGISTSTANITAGLYVAKVTSTTYQGVDLTLCQASHPMPVCSCYYSQVT